MRKNQSRLEPHQKQRHEQRQLGQIIGRSRLLKNANPSTTIRRDLDLHSMATVSMAQVEYLNPTTIVSADSHGRIEVHRLPVGRSGRTYKVLDLPNLQDRPTPLKLFSLSDACSFAVGLPNGDYRIYSGEEGRWSTCEYRTPIPGSSQTSIYRGYQRLGPHRRYHRDRNSSLWNSSHYGLSDSTTTWSQISNWETKGYLTRPYMFHGFEYTDANLPCTPCSSPPQNGWAFRETGSTLYSAFVDPECDCFSVMDHRVKAPVVCYYKPQSNHEDIATCCFLSDHALATSHSWNETASLSDLTHMHSVQVWDLRKLNKTPVSRTPYLPQFPRDSIACMESTLRWCVSERENEEQICVGPSARPSSSNRHTCINKLVASCDTTTIMISLQSVDQSADLVFYDYIRDSVTSQFAVPQHSVVAVTPSLDHVAVAHTEVGVRTKISLLDPRQSRRRPSRKRPAGTDIPLSNTAGSVGTVCGAVVGHMSPVLEDSMGIRTRLESLSWSADGTSVAGGSLDGDLFVWDGLSQL